MTGSVPDRRVSKLIFHNVSGYLAASSLGDLPKSMHGFLRQNFSMHSPLLLNMTIKSNVNEPYKTAKLLLSAETTIRQTVVVRIRSGGSDSQQKMLKPSTQSSVDPHIAAIRCTVQGFLC